MKKALVAALAFVLVGFMMVNGTLASVLNQARDIFADLGDALGKATTDSTFDVDLVNVGNVEQLYPGGSATTTVRVDNVGELPACFRLAFAVQETDAWDKQQLDISFAILDGDTDVRDSFIESAWMDITIGGTAYKMKVFTYKEQLPTKTQSPAKAQSPTVSITIRMDKKVTTAQINQFRADFLKTQVLAIDADTFLVGKNGNPAPYASPVAALDAALPLNTSFNPFQ